MGLNIADNISGKDLNNGLDLNLGDSLNLYPVSPTTDARLLETGRFRLLETGSFRLLE